MKLWRELSFCIIFMKLFSIILICLYTSEGKFLIIHTKILSTEIYFFKIICIFQTKLLRGYQICLHIKLGSNKSLITK